MNSFTEPRLSARDRFTISAPVCIDTIAPDDDDDDEDSSSFSTISVSTYSMRSPAKKRLSCSTNCFPCGRKPEKRKYSYTPINNATSRSSGCSTIGSSRSSSGGRFESVDEIKEYYKDKLEEIEEDHNLEIKNFKKQWEKAQVQASVTDFQDFCFLEGTKLILKKCGNDQLAKRPFKSEENINLRKCNLKYEQLFEQMTERHESEIKFIVINCQKAIEAFKSRRINAIINSELKKMHEEASMSSTMSFESNYSAKSQSPVKRKLIASNTRRFKNASSPELC